MEGRRAQKVVGNQHTMSTRRHGRSQADITDRGEPTVVWVGVWRLHIPAKRHQKEVWLHLNYYLVFYAFVVFRFFSAELNKYFSTGFIGNKQSIAFMGCPFLGQSEHLPLKTVDNRFVCVRRRVAEVRGPGLL